MAKKQASGVRFDDFVGTVRADPGAAEPLVLLGGYIGRGTGPGSVRIHPDASLNHWYEVAAKDVVHTAPIENSPLGGSNVWLKASAPIGYGVAAPAPPEPPQSEAAAPDTTAPVAATPHPLGAPPPAFTQMLCPTTMPPGCALPAPAVAPTQSLMACMPMQPPGGPPTQSLMACMPMQPQGTLPTAPTLFCQPATGLTYVVCPQPPPAPPIWSVGCPPPPPPAGPPWTAGCPGGAPTQGCIQTMGASCLSPFQPVPTFASCPGVSIVFMCPPR